MRDRRRILLVFIIGVAYIVVPTIAGAEGAGGSGCTGGGSGGCDVGLPNPLGETTTICGLLQTILYWMTIFAAPIFVGVIIYGAYQILLSQGNPEKLKTAKRTILYAMVAYAIILIGWGFTKIIANFLGAEAFVC